MIYRICKTFTVENGHLLSKHPAKCRFPHGHSRQIEVVIAAKQLDANEMVCDFKALKLLVGDFLERFDHAICVNSQEKLLPALQEQFAERVLVYENADPTTEVMAAQIYTYLTEQLRQVKTVVDPQGGIRYSLQPQLILERVRVWETASSWAEVSAEGAASK